MDTKQQNKDSGDTMIEVMYPSVAHQKDGKKWEPTGVAFSPKLITEMVMGEHGPYDKAPRELLDVNWNEPPVGSLVEWANAMHLGGRQFERPEEFATAQQSMMALGFGITMGRAAMAFVKRTAMHGSPPYDSASSRAALEKDWGDKTDANLAEVKALVADGKKKWPGLGKWLTSGSGLGNDPQFVQFLHKAAKRRKERGHG